MKTYKIILIVSSTLCIGFFLIITSLDIPAPSKQMIKTIDINNASVN